MHPPANPIENATRSGAPAPDACHHEAPVVLTPAFEAAADEIVTHYPVSKRSATLPLLHYWQEAYGHISEQAVEWVAKKLELQPINVMEVVTFYPMFRRHPAGKIQVKVCRTLSCALGGGYELRDYLAKKLGVGAPDAHGLAISPDGKYSVEFVECLASCGTAPVMMIGDDFHEAVTHAQADALLRDAAEPR
jgi:NADH-quinone oxidoreductase subunit E